MIKASTSILKENTKSLLDKMMISYEPLKNSKQNELAFTTCNHKTREFEIKYMANGTYRVCTRFVGYRDVMKKCGLNIVKGKDPDGRRASFYVVLVDVNSVNELVLSMVKNGYSNNPKVELI